MTAMDDLAAWLREQIAEDERVAQAAETRLNAWAPDLPPWESARYLGKFGSSFDNFVARHDPRSVLAQCEAHRRIIDAWDEWSKVAQHSHNPTRQEQAELYQREFAPILRTLALAYRHRPGYREAWKP